MIKKSEKPELFTFDIFDVNGEWSMVNFKIDDSLAKQDSQLTAY